MRLYREDWLLIVAWIAFVAFLVWNWYVWVFPWL